MRAALVVLTACLFLSLSPVHFYAQQESTPPLGPAELVAQGVALHDEERYAEAIERYRQALEIDPENVEALYELANTFAASGQLDACVETANRALKLAPGELEAALYSIAGSCLSTDDKGRKAMRMFRAGLKKHPLSFALHFNVAVRLAHDGKTEQAISHLKTCIEQRPGYASPFFILGELLKLQGNRVPALYFYLRFFMLAPNDPRTATAAHRIVEIVDGYVTREGPDSFKILLDPDAAQSEGDYSTLDTMLAFSAAAATLEEEAPKSDAARLAGTISRFVAITGDHDAGPKGLPESFTSEWAIRPVLGLHEQDLFLPLAYLVALRAELAGAEEYLDAHSSDLEKLSRALAAAAP